VHRKEGSCTFSGRMPLPGILQTDFRFHIVPPSPPLFLSLSLSLSFFLSLFLCLAFSLFLFPSPSRPLALPLCIVRIHTDGVSFRILAFDRVLGPVSVGVMIEREGYRALPLARPSIAHSTRFSRALLERSRLRLRNPRSNGRSEIETIVSLTKHLSVFHSFPTPCLSPSSILADYRLFRNSCGFQSHAQQITYFFRISCEIFLYYAMKKGKRRMLKDMIL